MHVVCILIKITPSTTLTYPLSPYLKTIVIAFIQSYKVLPSYSPHTHMFSLGQKKALLADVHFNLSFDVDNINTCYFLIWPQSSESQPWIFRIPPEFQNFGGISWASVAYKSFSADPGSQPGLSTTALGCLWNSAEHSTFLVTSLVPAISLSDKYQFRNLVEQQIHHDSLLCWSQTYRAHVISYCPFLYSTVPQM
jgi:hypothetical protein